MDYTSAIFRRYFAVHKGDGYLIPSKTLETGHVYYPGTPDDLLVPDITIILYNILKLNFIEKIQNKNNVIEIIIKSMNTNLFQKQLSINFILFTCFKNK